jgi:hypothetical protein
MGWYSGKQSFERRWQCQQQVMYAYGKFKTSLSDHVVEEKSFIDKLQANNDRFLLPETGMTQSEFVEEINRTTESETSSIAIAIACSSLLNDFEGISDSVCVRLVGLYLNVTIHLPAEEVIKFLRRCPNLVSLTVIGVDNCNAAFLKQVFQEKLLSKLETLHVSRANDDAIAAMSSAPNLKQITLQNSNDENVTNAGFARLVVAGGGKNLMYISVRSFDSLVDFVLSCFVLQKLTCVTFSLDPLPH